MQTLDVSKQVRAVQEMRARRTRSVGKITLSDVDLSGDDGEPSNGTGARNSRKCINFVDISKSNSN